MRPQLRNTPLARGWIQHAIEDMGGAGSDFMDQYLTSAMWLGQCSLAAVSKMLERMQVKKFRYVLHHVSGAYAIYMRKDIHKALAKDSSESSFASWLRGWYCIPSNRFFAKLELIGGPDVARLADPSLSLREKEKILCYFLDRHNIMVQQRNFDCQRHFAHLDLPEENCVRPDHRGWGNDAAASESLQESVGACEAHCTANSCNYWTYDPTAVYGQPLCWIWVAGRPAEIKSERGWISGDADCQKVKEESALQENVPSELPPEDDEPPMELDPEPGATAEAGARPKSGREIFKEWAVKVTKEIPGMRYFLESTDRGRCVIGFCECFPPFRGPLCDQVDSSPQDSQRNYSAVLHYLTSDDNIDIADIQHSLPRLWRRFNRRFDYPVVIFHDGLSDLHRQQAPRRDVKSDR